MMHEIDILNLASGLAAHAGRRQGVIAQNVANADTPGYQARDLSPFSETYAAERLAGGLAGPAPFVGRATRPGHAVPDVESTSGTWADERFVTAIGATSPDGNTVSLEDQMGRAAQTKLDHDLALGVWRSALGILRASLGSAGR